MIESIKRAQRLAKSGLIFAPSGFMHADPLDLIDICNGGGAKGSIIKVPDTIWGTSVVESFHVHDYMYHYGTTNDDKEAADRTMRNNLIRQVMLDEHLWYKPTKLQLIRVNTYYQSVACFGGPAFWRDKN